MLALLQEDAGRLRRKLDKHKKTELYSADEVLMEEIKEYKVVQKCNTQSCTVLGRNL